ncbi:hypothetical protein GQ53DRAFT_759043 [Thozetella sp. PMI_491]|nr:hypothetical protein GQ53DRAFT_759043 [Thozetella sp. PMI_491]
MPRTGANNEGGIEIKVPLRSFKPGDHIDGHVALKPDAPTPATVHLELFGRAKSKFSVARGRFKSIYRGRAPLLRLHLDLARDGATWPFSLTIPAHPVVLPKQPNHGPLNPVAGDFTADDDCEWPPDPNFLSHLDDQSSMFLPSITYFKELNAATVSDAEAYIEYALVATATTNDDEKFRWTATVPLLIRNASSELPIQNYEPTITAYRYMVQSSKLPSGAEPKTRKVSFGKKLMQALGSGSSKYSFRVYLELPGILQLDHPDPIPMRVWMMPVLDPEFTTVPRAAECPILLRSASVALKASYGLRVPDGNHGTRDCWTNASLNFTGIKLFNKPVPVAPSWAAEADNAEPEGRGPHANRPTGDRNVVTMAPPERALGLGALLRITLHKDHVLVGGRKSAPCQDWTNVIEPTFRTYNYHVSYNLAVNLELECAEKVMNIRHEQPVTVIATSEAQMRQLEETLGEEGMRENYDDLMNGLITGAQIASSVLRAII